MYTELKSYQIVIALLKKYGIRHCVLSAGSRNVPFVHSVEEDPDFKCYSVVDERSAGYFALGLAQELNEPVVISCTASTASCNYWPPVAEAFYQGVPIIILTSDRDPRMLGQREDQMIDQVGMFNRHVKKAVNLPIIYDKNDEIYCQRLVNEALLALNHKGTGPVHINVPMISYNNSFNVKILPKVTKFERLSVGEKTELLAEKLKELKAAKRILVACGQSSIHDIRLEKAISQFFTKYNSAIAVEYMSNLDIEGGLNFNIAMDERYININKAKEILPDIIISFGGNIFSGVKDQLRKFPNQVNHWLIQEDGEVCDLFKNLTTIFECSPIEFFTYFNENSNGINNNEYYTILKEYVDSVQYPEFEWSHVYAIKNMVEQIKENSILHLSINDSIRIVNFFNLRRNIKTYANIGTFGIDGCLSSFLGQACASPNKQSYLVIGDLAFFYDMNALKLNSIGTNVHVLLINNQGGSEFYFNKTWRNESSDLHTTARHYTRAEGWVKSNDIIYLSAGDKESYRDALKTFMREDLDKPVFLEVLSEMRKDAEVIHSFFDLSRPKDLQTETLRKSKELIKSTIGQDRAKRIATMFKK